MHTHEHIHTNQLRHSIEQSPRGGELVKDADMAMAKAVADIAVVDGDKLPPLLVVSGGIHSDRGHLGASKAVTQATPSNARLMHSGGKVDLAYLAKEASPSAAPPEAASCPRRRRQPCAARGSRRHEE